MTQQNGLMSGPYTPTFGPSNNINTALRVANTGDYNWFRGGDRGEWMDINPADKEAILAMYQEEGYNPYYGRHFNNQNYRRLNDALGRDVTGLGGHFDAYDNRMSGNMMDYLYDKTKDASNFQRDQTNRRFTQWMRDNNVSQKDLFQSSMTKQAYDAMGLQDVIGEYDASYGGGGIFGGGNPLNQNTGSSTNPLGGIQTSSTGGGFLDSYLKTKDELNNKTSVKSLFKDMENFDE